MYHVLLGNIHVQDFGSVIMSYQVAYMSWTVFTTITMQVHASHLCDF